MFRYLLCLLHVKRSLHQFSLNPTILLCVQTSSFFINKWVLGKKGNKNQSLKAYTYQRVTSITGTTILSHLQENRNSSRVETEEPTVPF